MHKTIRITAVLALALAIWAPVRPIFADEPIDCSGIESNIEIQLGQFFVARLQEIKTYLEDGNSPIGIPAKFRFKSEEIPLDTYSTSVVITDLTGDGTQEIVVTLSKGILGWIGSSGAFVFQKCSDKHYTIHYLSIDPASPYLADYSEVSVTPVRLLANRSSQLLVRYGSVQSGRCYGEVLLVIGQEQGSWITYLIDEVGCGSRDVTTARRISARDPDAIGRKGLLLSGDHWTGWGIYQFAVRPVRVFYTWKGDGLQFEKRVYLSSAYRFHALQDAQIAFEAGDTNLALQYYRNAATLGYLKDSFSWYEFETMQVGIDDMTSITKARDVARQYQTAFAYFRALVIGASASHPNSLQIQIDEIGRKYPAGKPGHEFAELAWVFQNEFIKSKDKARACQQVNSLVDSQYPNLTGQNGHVGNWGDESEFTIDVACPY